MAKNKKESFFWISYSDLMTSLFFIMLVLFVLVVALLHSRLKTTQTELNQIKQLNKSIEKIDKQYFEYDSVFKRHTLKNIQVEFPEYGFSMDMIPKDQQQQLIKAGNAIQKFMKHAQDSIPNAEYMLIIEGQSSRDYFGLEPNGTWKIGADDKNNDVLSYKRAFKLVEFWNKNGITFDSLPCEIIISGSGWRSRFREMPDKPGNKKNQRFVIHIIPKPGNFEEK